MVQSAIIALDCSRDSTGEVEQYRRLQAYVSRDFHEPINRRHDVTHDVTCTITRAFISACHRRGIGRGGAEFGAGPRAQRRTWRPAERRWPAASGIQAAPATRTG